MTKDHCLVGRSEGSEVRPDRTHRRGHVGLRYAHSDLRYKLSVTIIYKRFIKLNNPGGVYIPVLKHRGFDTEGMIKTQRTHPVVVAIEDLRDQA